MSRLENVLIANYKDLCRNIDWDRQVVITPYGQRFHLEEDNISTRFIVLKSKYAEKVKALELSIQEEAILRAILILSVGKNPLGYYSTFFNY